jgi:hypothetical protein
MNCLVPSHWHRCRQALALAGILLGASSLTLAQGSLTGTSPFLPSDSAGVTAANAAPSDYVLAGSSVSGGVAVVCVVQSDTKRSRWIAVGETVDGIQVLSFDADHDRAVVIAHGARKTLTLRKAAVSALPAVASTPVSAPVMPVAPALLAASTAAPAPTLPPPPLGPPGSEARAETEARMMVSDLLEIGMQQRKAYEDARNQPAGPPPAQPLK